MDEKKRRWHREWHAKNRDRRNAERRERYRNSSLVRAKAIASARAYYEAQREARPLKATADRYGLTEDQLELMLNDGCAICGGGQYEPVSVELHVDHDHATGQVRGILCSRCNLGLGHFADDPLLLAAATDYLLKFAASTLKEQHGLFSETA